MADRALAGSIPANMEVIVQVCFRVRGAEFAESNVAERHRVRTPEELDAAIEATRDAMWNGTQQLLEKLSRPTPGGQDRG